DEMQDWEGAEFVEAPLQGQRWRARGTLRHLLRSQRFSLIHTHGLTTAAQVVLANLGHRVPHVVHSHDVFRSGQFPGLTGRLKLWLLEQLLGRVDALASVSWDAQANLLEYLPRLDRSRCRLVPILNGIDTQRLAERSTDAQDLRRRLGIGPDMALLGFLGR